MGASRGLPGRPATLARVFEVSLRNVKAARAELLRLGVMVSCFAPQKVWDEHGGAFLFNFRWDPHPTESPPLNETSTTTAPPQERTGISSFGRSENTNLGCKGTPGVRKRTGREPTLAAVEVADLKSPRRLLVLLDLALRRGVVGRSENERLNFFAAAELALRYGRRNPPGMFVSLLRRRQWEYTLRDEDRARRTLMDLFLNNTQLT